MRIQWTRPKVELATRYPWAQMRPGDWFLVSVRTGEDPAVVQRTVRAAGTRWLERNRDDEDLHLETRQTPAGVAVHLRGPDGAPAPRTRTHTDEHPDGSVTRTTLWRGARCRSCSRRQRRTVDWPGGASATWCDYCGAEAG